MCNSNHRYKRIQSISYTLSKAINHICFIYAAEIVLFNFIQVMAVREIPILENVQKSSGILQNIEEIDFGLYIIYVHIYFFICKIRFYLNGKTLEITKHKMLLRH